MALQVWLPLNGNLNNLGLANVTMTNNGATVDNSGKIGKCYYFDANSYISENSYNWTNFNINTFSLCCWYKEPSPVASGNSQIICIGTNSEWNNIRIGLLRRTSNGYVMFSVSDGSSAVNYNCTTTTFELNTWNHIVCTYDNGVLKIYLNGVLNKTYTTTIVPVLNSSQHLGIGAASSGAEKLTGYLNDVRIYDHALSPKEVEELSKGLVLHYKLDDQYSENTTNIDPMRNLLSTNSINIPGFGRSDSNCVIEIVEFDGCKCYKLSINKDNISSLYGCYFNVNPLSYGASVGSTITRSMMMYIPSGQTIPNHLTESIEGNSTNKIYKQYDRNNLNTWQKVSHTGTISDTNTNNYLHYFCAQSTGNIHFVCYVKDFQMEIKDHATPYVNGTRTATIIYDSSGYNNNGTITGTPVILLDTPRYIHSTKFIDSATSIGIGNLNNLIPAGIFTFNIWFKKVTGEWSTKAWETILGGPSGFELEGKLSSTTNAYIHPYSWGGGSTSTPNSYSIQYNLDQWNMLTMVRTASNTKFYLNGELKVTGTAGSIPSGNYFIGAWQTATRQNYRGFLSDARLYCTALNDSQILELYNTSAIIDNLGNDYCYLFEESISNVELNPPLINFNHTSGTINFDGKDLIFTGLSSSYSNYIEVDVSKTLNYDITFSNLQGSWFLIGFERYDANKTTVSNSGCIYIYTSTSEQTYKRITGTVTLSEVNGNPCKYTRIRVLSCWNPLSTISGGIGKIHSFHFTLTNGTGSSEITLQGQVKTGWFIEDDLLQALISKNKYMTANQLIEI